MQYQTFPDSNADLMTQLDAFKAWLESADIKPSTRRVHLSRLKQFTIFAQEVTVFQSDSNAADLIQLFDSFISHGKHTLEFKPTTANNFVSTFRLFGKVTGQSINGLDYEKGTTTQLRRLTALEKENYLQALRNCKCIRDQVLGLLFLTAGIKIGECINLLVSDFVWHDESVSLASGNGGIRPIELKSELRDALKKWLAEREYSPVGTAAEYLFFGATGNPLTTTAVDAVIRKIGWRAGLNVCASVLSNTCTAPLTNIDGTSIVTVSSN